MKYVILVGDGMGDYPLAQLAGRTPLQAAATPNLDELARRGELGLARTIPAGMEPGSDIANLAIMGYDPARYHTGRAPLEAAALGVALAPEEVAFRCNLVTLRHENEGIFMEDYAAGHISSEEAREIIQVLDSALGQEGRRFYPGVSYRHLLVWAQGEASWRTYPPHDWTGQEVGHLMTAAAAPLWDLVKASWPVLQDYEVNRRRLAAGQKPATSIWLWGQGRPPQFPTLQERFGLSGAVISAVDLIRGIGKYAGLTPILVPGATGYLDTNYAGKVSAALDGPQGGGSGLSARGGPGRSRTQRRAGAENESHRGLRRPGGGAAPGRLKGPWETTGSWRCATTSPRFPCAPTARSRCLTCSTTPARPGDRLQFYTEADARETGLLLEQAADLLPRLLERL